jgi:hypothetical protein
MDASIFVKTEVSSHRLALKNGPCYISVQGPITVCLILSVAPRVHGGGLRRFAALFLSYKFGNSSPQQVDLFSCAAKLFNVVLGQNFSRIANIGFQLQGTHMDPQPQCNYGFSLWFSRLRPDTISQ